VGQKSEVKFRSEKRQYETRTRTIDSLIPCAPAHTHSGSASFTVYPPLCATARQIDYTHETALLTSILNQEKLANELLGALAQGKGPTEKLVEKVSLKHAAGNPK